jgi:hypothetical protein
MNNALMMDEDSNLWRSLTMLMSFAWTAVPMFQLVQAKIEKISIFGLVDPKSGMGKAKVDSLFKTRRTGLSGHSWETVWIE